ncbi:MAG TPA: EamA family transporter [Steroidobacteraceae bacterium]|nr:EamA family transporter [Steroidobacteraceae bacterium]
MDPVPRFPGLERHSPERPHRLKLIVCFAVIYLVWGSSYLAMRIGVQHLSPTLFAGVRFMLAGALLAAFAALRGARLPQSAREWKPVLVMGVLTVLISNGINNWAIQWVPSNQSALLNATSAFWIAGLGTFGPRGHSLSTRSQIGLVIGFVGAALILWPRSGFTFEALGPQLTIVVACMSWAAGTLYYRSVKVQTDPLMFTALQMLSGGVLLVAAGAATQSLGTWEWSWPGVGTLLYLTFFSSCLAYTAYAWLMVNTTPDRLATYSYVNPAVAAVLGWLVLGERLSGLQLIGMVVILGGVMLLTLGLRLPAWLRASENR